MEVYSEKVFYERDVADTLRVMDTDVVLWGEDLYDTKIVLYPKKITLLPGYEEIKPRLVNACLVYFDFAKEKFIKSAVVRWDEDTRTIYASEGNFNSVWKHLRNSVELGIRIKQKNGEEISTEKAEDIVELSYLKRKGSEALFKDGQLVYEARKLSESELIAQGKKQSALDNQKNKYFYSELDNRYHDKDCELIKEIPPEKFLASAIVPEGYKPCRKCCRRMYLREACAPYVRQIGVVDYMLMKQGITDFYLEKIAFDYGLKFRVDNEGELTVKGEEDTWLIRGFDSGKLSLWHNNYVKTAPRERYITSGYHNQGLDGKKLYTMLGYINGYTFEKHLVAEEQMAEAQEKEKRMTETQFREQEKIPKFESGQDKGKGFMKRVILFLKNLFS